MAGFGTDEAFAVWLSENGYTLPDGAPTPAVLRQRGSQYPDGAYGARFSGSPAGGMSQERQWPRVGATYYGEAIPSDVVPLAIVYASYEAAVQEANDPGSLSAIGSGVDQIKREKVGKIEVEYQAGSDAGGAANLIPIITDIEGLVAPFLRPTGGFPAILVV